MRIFKHIDILKTSCIRNHKRYKELFFVTHIYKIKACPLQREMTYALRPFREHVDRPVLYKTSMPQRLLGYPTRTLFSRSL